MMRIRIVQSLLALESIVVVGCGAVHDDRPHRHANAASPALAIRFGGNVAAPSRLPESLAVAPEHVGLFPNEMAPPALAWLPRDG